MRKRRKVENDGVIIVRKMAFTHLLSPARFQDQI